MDVFPSFGDPYYIHLHDEVIVSGPGPEGGENMDLLNVGNTAYLYDGISPQ
jgi:hypothetical protein